MLSFRIYILMLAKHLPIDHACTPRNKQNENRNAIGSAAITEKEH